MQTETRTFSVSPEIIRHLISSQAGTLGKAVAECVMNSLDAGATAVDIQVTHGSIKIVDDGHGFRSREEILACFEVFGFKHDDRSRTFGKYGLGRGQLWNWVRTRWRTRTFALDVDIRERGLDYTLATDLEDMPGMSIEGIFYTPLTEVEKNALLTEVDHLCRYVAIPVRVNGKDIRRDPSKAKWTYEDERVWIKVEDSRQLHVYNQGVYVRAYSTATLGIGGTLVTKRGHDLSLNMARSDVLTHQCSLWRDLRGTCATLAGAHIKEKAKKTRLNDDERDYLAIQSAEAEHVDNLLLPLFTLTTGRHLSLPVLMNRCRAGAYLTVAEAGDRLAERAMREGHVLPLTEATLTRFGVESPKELVRTLITRLSAVVDRGYNDPLRTAWIHLDRLYRDGRVVDRFEDCPAFAALEASTVPSHEWTPAQRAVIQAIEEPARAIRYLVGHARQRSSGPLASVGTRALCVGRSNACEAFTDGSTFIAIEEKVLEDVMRGGLPQMVRLMGIIVHEYVHDTADSGSHQHDHEFYEIFHDVMLTTDARVYCLAVDAYKALCRGQDRLRKKSAKDLDVANRAAA